ncbi:MAG: lipopolysaccharide biosynthesis protein [Acidimicrobiia bacterium]
MSISEQPGLAARLGRDGTAHMVGATGLAAMGAYLFQVVGGRVLGPVEFAPVTVLWTIQFLAFTVLLFPIEQFATRQLALGPERLPGRVLGSAAGVIAAVAAGTVLFVWATRERLFLGEGAFAVAAGLIVIGYGLFALGRGYLAGRRRFRAYGLVTGAESISRLVAAGLVLATIPSGLALTGTMALAPLAILLWRPFREGEGEAADGGGLGRFLAGYVAASAASQTILAGGPLVVAALGASPAAVSVFFVTFTLFRGPLTMGYSLLARVLPPFTRVVAEGDRARLRPWAVRLGVGGALLGALGGLVGLWVGPAIVALLFGEQFRPEPLLAAMAVAGVVVGSAAMVGNQVLVARNETPRLAVAWLAALAVAAVVLAVAPGSPSLQTGAAFVAGEAAALAFVSAAVWRPSGSI